MSKTGIIVLARLDSRRLPGKALEDIGGRPLLGRVLDRARLIPNGHRIVVATSNRAIDDGIVDFADSEGVDVFRGAAEDVAQRMLDCCYAYGFTRFARVVGDSPFLDPELFGRFETHHRETGADVVTNLRPRTFPPGMSIEIIKVSAFRQALRETRDPVDREHVTPYFYAHPERFDIRNISAESDNSDLVLTVDTPDDLERARWIISQLEGPPERASADSVIALARRWFNETGQRKASNHG